LKKFKVKTGVVLALVNKEKRLKEIEGEVLVKPIFLTGFSKIV